MAVCSLWARPHACIHVTLLWPASPHLLDGVVEEVTQDLLRGSSRVAMLEICTWVAAGPGLKTVCVQRRCSAHYWLCQRAVPSPWQQVDVCLCAETMFRALEQLYALGALNDKGELTTMGEVIGFVAWAGMLCSAVACASPMLWRQCIEF